MTHRRMRRYRAILRSAAYSAINSDIIRVRARSSARFDGEKDMAQVLIRNLPQDIIEAHRARAKAHGRSLEQELREVIERAAPYTPEERLAVALHFQSQTPAGPRTDPVEAIREGRDD